MYRYTQTSVSVVLTNKQQIHPSNQILVSRQLRLIFKTSPRLVDHKILLCEEAKKQRSEEPLCRTDPFNLTMLDAMQFPTATSQISFLRTSNNTITVNMWIIWIKKETGWIHWLLAQMIISCCDIIQARRYSLIAGGERYSTALHI